MNTPYNPNGFNTFQYGVARSVAYQLASLRTTNPDAFQEKLNGHIADLDEETRAAFIELVIECAMELERKS